MMPETQMSLEITPVEVGSVAGSTQTAAVAVVVTEGMKKTAEKEQRGRFAEFVAAAGRATLTAAAGSTEADSVDVAGPWAAAGDTVMGAADEVAGTAAGSTEAGMTEAVEAETGSAAVDKKFGSERSGMVVAVSMEAAVAGDEDFAGCNMESGSAVHMHLGPAVRKEESAAHMRCCPLHSVSCLEFPWDISGGSVAHMAALDSHVLAVAPTEVPAAVCTGYFLHMAEVSSSPSDPLGLKAAGS